MKLCECGCGLPTNPITENDASKGQIKGEWMRFIRYHKPPLKTRFMSRFDKVKSGCWEWNASRFEKGYGSIVDRGKLRGAHRVSWEMFKGPIPAGVQVLHRCDNPPCVNPDHLFLGTNTDNMRDRLEKGRYKTKVTEKDVLKIRALATQGMRKPIIALQFGIHIRTVYQIIRNDSWRHI